MRPTARVSPKEGLHARPLKRGPLFLDVRNSILQMIADEGLVSGSRLPSETALSERFGVSRVTLREALLSLEEEGCIVREHGVGTFVLNSSAVLENKLELMLGITELIESMHLQAGTSELHIVHSKADEVVANRLHLPTGGAVIVIERVRTANGEPVVYSLDNLPETLPTQHPGIYAFSGSLYQFLEEQCGLEIMEGVATLSPVRASSIVAAKLNVPRDSALFLLEQVDCDRAGTPVLFSKEYFSRDAFQFTVRRRRKASHE